MTIKSKVSVLIPVFNVEKYIKDSVQSIRNQTYKNIEIIVIDDGSTDDTFGVVAKIAESDKRIKLFKNEKNIGIVKTLNRALELSTGEYIARMDGDDISELDRIEKIKLFRDKQRYTFGWMQLDC